MSGIFIADGTTRLSDEVIFGNAPGLPSSLGATSLGTFNGAALTYSIVNTAAVKGQITFAGTTASQLQASDVINFYNGTLSGAANISSALGASV